jgi:amino acid permease
MKRKRPIWHLVVAVLTLICMVLICWGAPYYVECNAFCSNCASGEEHGGLLFIE